MRVVVRRQGNPCGCAVVRALGLLRESILAEVRYENDWGIAMALAERIPDELRKVDAACGVDITRFNVEIQAAIRSKDLHDLTEAIAKVDLAICGESTEPVEFTTAQIEEAARRTLTREREAEELR